MHGLSLWMGQDIHQFGSLNSGSGPIFSTDPLVSNSNPPASGYQLFSHGQELTSTSLPLNNVKENGARLVSVPSLFSTQQLHSHQPPSANMSATALLQKAAEIGATSTDTSFLGSFGAKCSNSLYVSNMENSAHDISTLNQLQQMYPPAKRMRTQNEDNSGGHTRDFLGVGVLPICHPSSVNGYI
ncbi:INDETERMINATE DOMAIN 8, NUTCRACKER [Hibiscus trionum]|nr:INDETERMINATE DOMAIN 8, NUTCRACKER [Hibiscus trionum]